MGSLTHLCDDTRSAWRARPPNGELRPVSLSTRTEFFNHYIGPGSPGFARRPHADCLKQVRDWQEQHQTRPGDPWKDIGYNALVCGHARVVEGRGLEYAGSHCPDHNTIGFGVQFMVAGTEKPTDAMYARMRRLYDDLVKAKGGKLAKKGHRDGVATTCPGDVIYAWVKAGMPDPTPTTPPEVPVDPTVPNYVGTPAAVDVVKALMRSDVFPSMNRATDPANPYVTGYQWLQQVNAALAELKEKQA